MTCSEKEKLGCTVSLLTSKAHYWWNTVEQGITAYRLTWEFFWETFKKKFMGEQYLEDYKHDFINLRHGELSVAEFVRLSQYVIEMVS